MDLLFLCQKVDDNEDALEDVPKFRLERALEQLNELLNEGKFRGTKADTKMRQFRQNVCHELNRRRRISC